jgi:hypothetical protein
MNFAFVMDAPRRLIEVSSSTFFIVGGAFAFLAGIWIAVSYALPRRKDKPRLPPSFWYVALTAAGLFAVGVYLEIFPPPLGPMK